MSKIGKKEQKILNQIARKKLSKVDDIKDIVQASNDIENITRGVPAMYSTPEEMEMRILEYIQDRKQEDKPLTITGLAISLGMSRRNLLEYKKKDNFYPIINKYRQVLLQQVEENLTDKSKFTPGQIFYLKNNYKEDYRDKIEIDNNHTGSISLVELNRLAMDMNEGDIIEGELADPDTTQEE